MPNWCENVLTLRHADKAQIARVVKAVDDGGLFQGFQPIPEALLETQTDNDKAMAELFLEKFGASCSNDWAVGNWGTKWDVDEPSVDALEDGGIRLSFNTAWGPPIGFYNFMHGEGFEVEAYYFEPGMGFCGSYTEGCDEDFNLDFGDKKDGEGCGDWVRRTLPERLVAALSLGDYYDNVDEEEK